MTNKQPGPVSQYWPDTDRSTGQYTVRGTTTGRHFYSSRYSRHWFVKWFYQTQVSTRLVLNLKYLEVSRNHMNPPSFFVSWRRRQDCMNNAKYKYRSSKFCLSCVLHFNKYCFYENTHTKYFEIFFNFNLSSSHLYSFTFGLYKL